MTQAIEMVRFTAKSGEEEALVNERPEMLEVLSAECPGMLSAQLAKTEEGNWLDVVVWKSREQALSAAEKAPRIPACATWFSHMDQVIAMEHADVVVADG